MKTSSTGDEISIPFAHPAFVRTVLDYLGSRGVQPSAVLERAGLAWQDLHDGQRMVDFTVFRRFVSHAIECSGDRALGLLAGAMFQPYHTPLGIAAVTSDTLGQALQFVARHAKLIFGGMEYQLENGPKWSTFKVKPIRPLCETHIFVIQSILGAYYRLLEAVLGRPVDELAVGLPYPRPDGEDESSLRYVRTVTFDQEYLTLQLPAKLLDEPSRSADPQAFFEAAQTCQRMESEQKRGEFVQRVRQALQERMTDNPDASELAADLGVSSRTLVRRLVEAGVTYSDIKDDLRKSHAAWYLKHTELSMESIASQLGYTDPTSFGRKFKDWYRMTPSTMRRELRAGAN
ncbi:MAG: AraC family transcriptional regulator [Variovorax sp.]|nr:AraC family transcriptional regulator [Variovorax sp.]